MSYNINVKANVDNTYGANVYAFALKTPEVNKSNLVEFVRTNLQTSTGIVQMNIIDDATTFHVSPSNTFLEGDNIAMEATLSVMFDSLESNADSTHPIPYAFSEYYVYVVAHNDLDMYAGAEPDSKRYNEYTIINEVTVILGNDLLDFALSTDNNDTSRNVVTVTSDIQSSTGNTIDYYVVGFVNSDITDDMVSWYIDRYISNIEYQENNTVVTQDINQNSFGVNSVLTNVVKDITDPTSVFDMNDVNNVTVFMIARDMGHAIDGTLLDTVHYYSTQLESQVNTSITPHARIESIRVQGNVLFANLSAYNSVEQLGVPTQIKVLAVERNANLLDTSSLIVTANVFGDAIPISGGEIGEVYKFTDHPLYTAVIGGIDTATPLFANIDPLNEYDLFMLLETDNSSIKTETVMLSSVEEPVHQPLNWTVVTNTSKPGAVVSDFNFDDNNSSVSGNITFSTHLLASNTTLHLIASTVSTGWGLSNVESIDLLDSAYFFSQIKSSKNVENTYPFTFRQVVGNDNFIGNVIDVHNVVLYAYTSVDDSGYSLKTLVETLPNTFTDITVLNDFSGTDDFYTRVDDVSIQYDRLYANVHSVFNNSATETLGNVYAFVTRGVVSDTDFDTLHAQLDTLIPSLNKTNDYGGRFVGLDLEPYKVSTDVISALSIQYVFTSDGTVETIQANTEYKLNVMGTSNSTNDLFIKKLEFPVEGNFGVKGLVGGFHIESGNIEITDGNVFVGEETGSELNIVAFTYDVRKASANLDDFQNKIYTAPANALVNTQGHNSDFTGLITNLEKIVDSNLDVENAFATRNAHVYGWVSNSINKSAVFEMNAVLNPADRFYPFIQTQNVGSYDGNVMSVTDASVIESNVISDQLSEKVDRYYIFGFDRNSITALQSAALSDSDLLSTFGDAVQGNVGVLGEYNDIEPNIDTNDIYVAENVSFTHVFTSLADPSLYDVLPIGGNIEMIILAVNTQSGTSKSFKREYVIPADGTVPGVRDLGASFTADLSNIEIVAGNAYGNIDHQAPHPNVYAMIYTYPLENPQDPRDSPSFQIQFGATPTFDFSEMTWVIPTSNVIDVKDVSVPITSVDSVYVYTWVEDKLGTSIVTNVSVPSTSDKPIYTQISHTETDTEVQINGSLFTSNVEVTQINNYYLALFETDALTGKSESDIKTIIIDNKNNVSTVNKFEDANIARYEAVSFTNLNITFTNAFSNVDTTVETSNVTIGSYSAYLLAEWDGDYQLDELAITKQNFGVQSASLSAALRLSTVVNGSEAGVSKVYAAVYTYPNPEGNHDTHKFEVSGDDVGASAIGENRVSGVLTQVVDESGGLVEVRSVNTFYAYVWVEDTSDANKKSVVNSGASFIRSGGAVLYPKLFDLKLNFDTIEISAGNISLFNPGTGNITKYFLAAFDNSISGDLVTFVVNNTTPITLASEVPPNTVFLSDLQNTIRTIYTDLSDPTQTSAVFTDEAYKMVLVAELSDNSFKYDILELNILTYNNINPGVKNFNAVLDMVQTNIDIATIDLHVLTDPETGSGVPTEFYISAFTYDVSTTTSNLDDFNTVVRSKGTLFANVDADAPTQVLYANVLTTMFDIDGETVPIATSNVAYMYAWASVNGSFSAATPSEQQAESMTPYPYIRSVSYPENPEDPKTITVNQASIFSPVSNIDKYYLFVVQKDVYLAEANVLSFVTSGTILNNSTFQLGISKLGEYNDFNPDLLEGNVYQIASSTITDAFVDLNDANITSPFVNTVSYELFLVSLDESGSTNLYRYPNFVTMPGAALVLPVATYMELDTTTTNSHTLSFAFEEFVPDPSANILYYAVASVLPSDSFDRAYIDTLTDDDGAPPSPVRTMENGEAADTTNTVFVVTQAYDIQGNLVDLHTVNTTYLYVWVRAEDGTSYLIADTPVNDGPTNQQPVFGERPVEVGNWVLLHRDVVGDPFTSNTIQNTNTAAGLNDFDQKYSILGDLEDGSLLDSEYKTDGEYMFRMIPYVGSDTQLAPDNNTRYIEWTQTSDPTLQTAEKDANGESIRTGVSYVTRRGLVDETTVDAPFLGLAPSTTNDWLDGSSPGRYYNIGVIVDGSHFDYTTPLSSYSTPDKVELWVWKGPKPVTNWVLLHRDVVGDPFTGSTPVNTNIEEPDNFDQKYSILGDLKDGSLSDSEYKTDGKYLFRMIPYNTDDYRVSPDNTTQYMQWTQTSNPTTTIAVESLDDTRESPLGMLNSANPFEGLALTTFTRDTGAAWIDGTSSTDDYMFTIGRKAYEVTNLRFANNHFKYDTINKNELWVWKGPKPIELTRLSYHSATYRGIATDNQSTATLGNGDIVRHTDGAPSSYNLKNCFDDSFISSTGFHGNKNPSVLEYTFASGPNIVKQMAIGQPVWNQHLIGDVTIQYFDGTSFVNVVNQSPMGFAPFRQQPSNVVLDSYSKFDNAGVPVFQTFTFDTVQSDKFQITAKVSPLASGDTGYPGFGEWEIWGQPGPGPQIDIENGEWTEVRRLPRSSEAQNTAPFFPNTDNLKDIGIPFTEFLFTRDDHSAWLICNKFAVYNDGTPYDNTPDPRTITKSSISPNSSYTAEWYNRDNSTGTTDEDPWISLYDYTDSVGPKNLIMYVESSKTGHRPIDPSTGELYGLYVYVRNNPNSVYEVL